MGLEGMRGEIEETAAYPHHAVGLRAHGIEGCGFGFGGVHGWRR
jgi:hypothetical protein